ncbi:hypothetical protein BVZ80_01575B, partial [Haemophilus influenzae]
KAQLFLLAKKIMRHLIAACCSFMI